MRITDFIRQAIQTDNTGTSNVGPQSAITVQEKIKQEILSLVPGKTIQGEVVGKNGNEVTLAFGNDVNITARLEQDIALDIGKLLTFEVKNNGKNLILSPLMTNTANSDNVMKALQMANIPINGKTIAMTEKMMQQGMSVDKNSLQNMFKEVIAHPDADVMDLVNLHKLGLSVNEANLGQMASYRNLTHALMDGMGQVLEQLPGTYTGLMQTEGADVAHYALNELLSKLGISSEVSDLLADYLTNDLGTEGGAENMARLLETMAGEDASTQNLSAEQNLAKAILADRNLIEQGITGKLTEGTPLNEAEMNLVKNLVGKMVNLENLSPEEMQSLLKDPKFMKDMKQLVLNQWTLTPESMTEEKEVERVYNRIEEQLKGMQEVLTKHGMNQNQPMMQSVTNLTQNVDFLNQLNQMYTYIQLPLKLQQGEKNGELYVFTNKRSLAERDGAVSALLHLDMEHLGPVDVYVTMQEGKVNTRFTVGNDDMLDFLDSHMHILTERLQKKGYDMKCEMRLVNEDAEKNPMEILIKSDKPEETKVQYGFDVRT